MTTYDERLSSGVAALDRVLDGLAAGDNLVWVADDPEVHDRLEHAFLGEGTGRRVLVALDGEVPDLPAGVEVLDGRRGRPHADPMDLERSIIAIGTQPGARIVIRSLDALTDRLGVERTVGFFTRTCPRLFDLGAIAYWRATRAGSAKVLDPVQRVTQCVLEVSGDRLRILKAEGRPGRTGQIFQIQMRDDRLELTEVRAASRLAEGLRRLRTERGLTQTEVARMAGVSPSAISQAESGHRGLGLDTLLVLADALGVGLDDLLGRSPDPGYVLARRDRIPARRGMVALLDDPTAGLRAHLIFLSPGESGGPPVVHKGAELIMVSNGVVQIQLMNETPVMRAGDALLVTRDAISGWRNLLPEPARLFWIVRD